MTRTSTLTMTMMAVDLSAVVDVWRSKDLTSVTNAAPHGRVASLLRKNNGGGAARSAEGGPVGVSPTGGPRGLAAALSIDEQRELFDALAEDLAKATLWDAPAGPLAEALAAIAKVAKHPELEASTLEASKHWAYPPELLDQPFVDRSDRRGGLLIWLSDPALVTAAQKAAERVLELPPGSFKAQDPALQRDLLETLASVLAKAARPGFSLVALRDQG
jgi:hypothetical protein